jgi:four helix bundle protein
LGLTDADGEQAETQHWLMTSNHCGYITDATRDDLLLKCQKIGRMLGAMMRAPEKFWRH